MIRADITPGVLPGSPVFTQAAARAARIRLAIMGPAVKDIAAMARVTQGPALISHAVWGFARTTAVRAVGVTTRAVAVATVVTAVAREVVAPTSLALEAVVRMDIVRATPARTGPAAVAVVLTVTAGGLCITVPITHRGVSARLFSSP